MPPVEAGKGSSRDERELAEMGGTFNGEEKRNRVLGNVGRVNEGIVPRWESNFKSKLR